MTCTVLGQCAVFQFRYARIAQETGRKIVRVGFPEMLIGCQNLSCDLFSYRRPGLSPWLWAFHPAEKVVVWHLNRYSRRPGTSSFYFGRSLPPEYYCDEPLSSSAGVV